MEYQKPEIFSQGKALGMIQSSLSKDQVPVDSQSGADLTGAAAYEADE